MKLLFIGQNRNKFICIKWFSILTHILMKRYVLTHLFIRDNRKKNGISVDYKV